MEKGCCTKKNFLWYYIGEWLNINIFRMLLDDVAETRITPKRSREKQRRSRNCSNPSHYENLDPDDNNSLQSLDQVCTF